MTRLEPKDSRALTALGKLLRDGVTPPTQPELERGLFALRGRLARKKEKRPAARLVWATLVVTLVGFTLGLVIRLGFRREPSPPTAPVEVAKVEGGKLMDGGYLSESGHAGIALSFNEGSEFRLSPGSRGRLRTVSHDGARFALEHGSATFKITQSRDHKWSVEAGPFSVSVRGTEFSVSWDPENERFGLQLRRGRVVVSGPILGQDLALRAGQNLAVNLPAAETVISESRIEASEEETTARPLSPAATASGLSVAAGTLNKTGALGASAAAPPPSAASSARRWGEALAHGRWDRILADVERDGVEATLQTASSEELLALADAARYRRRADLARAALLAQRRRFPGSPRARDALFLLGRVEELRAPGSAAAIGWYDQYLAGAPGGTYAAEALGRKMILSNEVTGPASSRPIAEEYLRRFPGGSYAGAARALQRGP
ncbi:MAG TPA: FecR domain-containing protein [Polyangiaceae bacterium]|nr:FecR domain-containing protein [Polyangiaceae bacterium]